MAKIDLENMEFLLSRNNIPQETIVKVVQEAQKIIEEEKLHRAAEANPKEKFEYSILISDPENRLNGVDLVGWIVKYRAGMNVLEIPEKLFKVARDFNSSSRVGQRNPVKTIGEVFEVIKRKFFKKENIYNLTKEPVLVLTTNNKLN